MYCVYEQIEFPYTQCLRWHLNCFRNKDYVNFCQYFFIMRQFILFIIYLIFLISTLIEYTYLRMKNHIIQLWSIYGLHKEISTNVYIRLIVCETWIWAFVLPHWNISVSDLKCDDYSYRALRGNYSYNAAF